MIDFSEVMERHGTDSLKWDFPFIVHKTEEERLASREALPMWVADMDFRCPQPVIDAIVRRAQSGVYGYTAKSSRFYEPVKSWLFNRHGWEIDTSWLEYTPGVLPAIAAAIQAFTEEGDGILLQVPVYYPFFALIRNWNRNVVENPLVCRDGRWTMDFEDLEQKARDSRTKMIILCSPHNPVGRVWTREELARLGRICVDNGVLVVADEIHSDIIYRGHRHLPFGSLGEEFLRNSISTFSPSKTFNLAGFHTSVALVADPVLHKAFKFPLTKNRITAISPFGEDAVEAAYTHGYEYLEELLAYLEGNLDFLLGYVKEKMKKVRVIRPEGTYLVWMDFRGCGLEPQEVDRFLLTKAKVFLDYGSWFGKSGEGFGRINIACPRPILEEGLERIRRALDAL